MRSRHGFAAVAFTLVLAAGAARAETVVDDQALGDESQGTNWLSYGRTYSEQRYSPLDQINKTTSAARPRVVARSADDDRGLERRRSWSTA